MELKRIVADSILAAAADAVVAADRDGIIRIWNPGAERIFGHGADEAIGQSLDLIIPEKLRQRHWDGYHRVMATGETKYGRELLAVPGQHKDGSRMSVEFSIAILRDQDGQIMGIAAILRDVTARWEQDRALHQRIRELEAQVRPVGAPAGRSASSQT